MQLRVNLSMSPDVVGRQSRVLTFEAKDEFGHVIHKALTKVLDLVYVHCISGLNIIQLCECMKILKNI